MASAKDQRINTRFTQVEKIANRANSGVEILKSDLETTHFDLLEKIRLLQEEINGLKNVLESRP